MKEKTDYPINDICYYYEDVIEEAVNDGLFKHKGEAISIINVIIHCGVDILDFDKVLFLLEKAREIKYSNNTDTTSEEYWAKKSDTSTIVYSLLMKYFSDDKGNIASKYKEKNMYENDSEFKLNYSKVKKKKKN